MQRPTKITKDEIEFIDELSDRFPDISDQEVMNAYYEYSKNDAQGGSIDGKIILYAYNHDSAKAIDYAKTVWGVEIG